MERIFKGEMKRPAGMKRPAAAMKDEKEMSKKPAAAVPKTAAPKGRPSLPPDTHKGKAIMYKQGKVLVSAAQEAYRVFPSASDTKERRIRWKQHPTRIAAWTVALDTIQE